MADFNSLLGAQKETNATLKKIAEAQGVTFETAKEQLQEAKNANRVAGGIKAAETRRANAAKGNKGAAEEQQKEDLPELLKMNAQAIQTEMLWEFFGGTITLPNGHVYQVMN